MSKKQEDKELDFLENYKIIASIILGAVFLGYLYSKTGLGFKISTAGDMGAIGDFFGGLLNPTFALIGLFALLATIKIQTKALKVSSEELSNSRQELELTRKEIKKSTIAQQEQSNSLQLQNFENTFFKMLDLHNEIMSSLMLQEGVLKINGTLHNTIINVGYKNKDTKISKDTIGYVLEIFYRLGERFNTYPNFQDKHVVNEELNYHDIKEWNTQPNQYNPTNELYLIFHDNLQQIFGHYFRNIYQLLKFISNSKINNKKFYTNIFRAQFSKDELELLFYNCTSNIGNEKFLLLLIEFEFLEHLPFNDKINKKDIIYCVDITRKLNNQYIDSKLYGKSIYWKNAIKDLCK